MYFKSIFIVLNASQLLSRFFSLLHAVLILIHPSHASSLNCHFSSFITARFQSHFFFKKKKILFHHISRIFLMCYHDYHHFYHFFFFKSLFLSQPQSHISYHIISYSLITSKKPKSRYLVISWFKFNFCNAKKKRRG
jgi:hypothetical protein